MGTSIYSQDDRSPQMPWKDMQGQHDGSGRLAYLIAQELRNEQSEYSAKRAMAQANALEDIARNSQHIAAQHASKSDPLAWYRIGDCYVFEYSNGVSETRCVYCFQEWHAGHNCLANQAAMPAAPNRGEPPIEISEEVKELLMDGMIKCEIEYQDELWKREFERLERLSVKE